MDEACGRFILEELLVVIEQETYLAFCEMPQGELVDVKLDQLIRAAEIDTCISQAFWEINGEERAADAGWVQAAIKVRALARKTIFSSYLDIIALGTDDDTNFAKEIIGDLNRLIIIGFGDSRIIPDEELQSKTQEHIVTLQADDYENRYVRPRRNYYPP